MKMWPELVDMTKEESIHKLRHLELEAYSHLVSALRAQGTLNTSKKKLLKEASLALNITNERHKAEIRRAVSDEQLNTVAYHINGKTESIEDWVQEGRRLFPLLSRLPPESPCFNFSNEIAESTIQNNFPLHCSFNTDRKRQITDVENLINRSLKMSENSKPDDIRKRKLSSSSDNISNQLMVAPSKISKIQQIYRQRTKSKELKEFKLTQDDEMKNARQKIIQANTDTKSNHKSHLINGPKINVLQNITFQPVLDTIESEDNYNSESNEQDHSVPTENQRGSKVLNTIKLSPSRFLLANSTSDILANINRSTTKKTGTSIGQKLIVVSSSNSSTSNSILQRTLSVPIVKNISLKNFDKFKIVSNSSPPRFNDGISNKQKMVTLHGNSNSKKVIPLSQLQVLNSKGNIKVLPLAGKTVSTVPATSQLLFLNSVPADTTPSLSQNVVGSDSNNRIENSNQQNNETKKEVVYSVSKEKPEIENKNLKGNIQVQLAESENKLPLVENINLSAAEKSPETSDLNILEYVESVVVPHENKIPIEESECALP